MDEQKRNQVVGHLDELRDEVAQRLGNSPDHQAVSAHVEELRALVQKPNASDAHSSAGKLERRLLAWEAEHPQLADLASRVVRALEDSGL